ncbi:flagellar biosynthesis protein FlhB [candidate division KSB1 bacterium]
MAEKGNDQQERTEQATPKRIEDARKKGQVAKSVELNSTAILTLSLLFFFFVSGYMIDTMKYYSQVVFENVDTIRINPDNLQEYLKMGALSFAKIIFPFVALIMIIGIGINYLQVGPLFTLEPLKPKFSKINPISGFKRVLFSTKALVELVKSISKILLIGLIAYFSIKGQLNEFIPLIDQSPLQIMIFIGKCIFSLGMKITLVLLVIAVLDYMFQKYDHKKSLKMTKQEIKEEYKQMEGDPHVKARIRSIQREMARRKMMSDVPEADVVITNPTEIAIALKYNPGEMEAPQVLAKGRKKIAEKIREIAKENDIPIVQNKPLAWAIYKAVNIGDFIPENLFQAVAEILAYVYKLKNKKLG